MNDLDLALALALDAGALIHEVYARDFTVETKDDGSPVTQADRAADHLIRAGLAHFRPHDAVLTEESGLVGPPASLNNENRQSYQHLTTTPRDPLRLAKPEQWEKTQRFRALGEAIEEGRSGSPQFILQGPGSSPGGRLWLVDPLDGTADFADRTGDFAVMIGLCIDGRPVLGVISAPALDRTWAAAAGLAFEVREGERLPLTIGAPETPPRVLVSRKHPPPAGVQGILARLGGATHVPRGSVGVKCGLLAAGEADLYLHPSRGTWLWDCAAPQALIEAAGGRFTRPDGSEIPYDLNELRNDPGVLVAGRVLHTRVLALR